MTTWATELEFAYEHAHLYVLDAGVHWSEAPVDLLMPRRANFFVPLQVEGWGGRPPLDLDAWDHVVEFPLPVPSGRISLASGGADAVTVGIAPGAYRARWSGRNLGAAAAWADVEASAPDAYRLQLWPGAASAPRAVLKRWPGAPVSGELGVLPALLDDESLRAAGQLARTERGGDALRVDVRVAALDGRTWECGLRADGVVRWVASSTPFRTARLYAEHPGLLPFADDQGGLSFNGVPADPDRLAHALRAEHAGTAGRTLAFEDVVNAGWDGALGALLQTGYGRLASGPVTLLRRYAVVAAAHGVETHLTVGGPGRAGLSLLELGDSFVVAERFSAY